MKSIVFAAHTAVAIDGCLIRASGEIIVMGCIQTELIFDVPPMVTISLFLRWTIPEHIGHLQDAFRKSYPDRKSFHVRQDCFHQIVIRVSMFVPPIFQDFSENFLQLRLDAGGPMEDRLQETFLIVILRQIDILLNGPLIILESYQAG